MDINAVQQGLAGATGASASGGGQGMDRDTFLQLLVTQLSHQDPLKPTEATEFVSQLAEFSALEQMAGVRESMELMLVSQAAATSAQVVQFVGKDVTFEDHLINWDGAGTRELQFELDADAASVEVQIKDMSGRLVRTESVGALGEGVQAISFDGLDDNLNPLPAGQYTFEVVATDAQGESIDAWTRDRACVTAVSFDGGYPQLVVEGGRTIVLAQVLSVHDASASDPDEGTAVATIPAATNSPPGLETLEPVIATPELPDFRQSLPFPTPK